MIATTALSAASLAMGIGQSLLAASMLISRLHNRRVYGPLAAFFICNVVSEASSLYDYFLDGNVEPYVEYVLSGLSMPASYLQPPLLWLYVRALTSQNNLSISRRDWRHLVLPAMSLITVILLFSLPAEVLEKEMAGTDPITTPMAIVVWWLVVAMMVCFYIQCVAYEVAIIRAIVTYRAKLKDLFASTENRELGWIIWITLIFGSFWLVNVTGVIAGVLFEMDLNIEHWSDFLNLIFVWTLCYWGLRQRPGLDPGDSSQPQDTDQRPSPAAAVSAEKYEKSALTPEHAERIARKIGAAMQKDNLYKNPNLSLWDLSKHIGVSPNYLSQTLNGTLGETFFDYVNSWRIKEAMHQISNSSDTILKVTYDVGFNSRSSFYKAFKRETGMTPSAFKTERDVPILRSA